MKKPPRWLPQKYDSYEALLAAAVEAAIAGPDAPADLAAWKWGKFHPIEIEQPVLGKLREVDLNRLTPLEALNLLAELKKEI